MTSNIRVAVIGVGGMGEFHARTLAALSAVEVVAVADPDADRRRAVADDLGCEAVADASALARATDLDGVVIASPDETHAELALAAIDAGAFVLCEKPLATSGADARRVVDAEVALGSRVVQVGFMRGYDLVHRDLVDALDRAGDPVHVRAVHRNVHPAVRPLERILRQSLVHDVHSVRFLTGAEIVEVTGFGSGPAGGSFRHVLVVCRLDSGATAVLEFDDGAFAYEVAVEVIASDGDVIAGQPSRALERSAGWVRAHVGADWFARFGDAYAAQDRAWVESVRRGVATGPTAWDGYVAELVCEAMLETFERGRSITVTVPERPALYDT